MNHEELAVQNFMSGYNCAQSVFLAFAPDFGMDRDAAARLSSSFGGGMGRLREVCGACESCENIDGCELCLARVRFLPDGGVMIPKDVCVMAAESRHMTHHSQQKN